MRVYFTEVRVSPGGAGTSQEPLHSMHHHHMVSIYCLNTSEYRHHAHFLLDENTVIQSTCIAW